MVRYRARTYPPRPAGGVFDIGRSHEISFIPIARGRWYVRLGGICSEREQSSELTSQSSEKFIVEFSSFNEEGKV
jgi:hypothetical protein